MARKLKKVDNQNTSYQSWKHHAFDFSGDANFSYSGATTFSFEILGYDATANGHDKTVWEFDELKIYGCCGTETTNETETFTCVQKITIDDNTAPVIKNVPANITITCIDDLPAVPTDVYVDESCAFNTTFEEVTTGNQPCNSSSRSLGRGRQQMIVIIQT